MSSVWHLGEVLPLLLRNSVSMLPQTISSFWFQWHLVVLVSTVSHNNLPAVRASQPELLIDVSRTHPLISPLVVDLTPSHRV